MSDDLDEIMEPLPVEEPQAVEEPEKEPEPEPEVAKEPEPAPEAEKPQQDMVPLSALLDVRRELQAVKSMIPQTQPEPKPVPDVLDDQQGFTGHIRGEMSQAVTGTKLEISRFMAEREFGADTVSAAQQYFDAHPEQSHALLQHPSPFHAAVEIYNRHVVAQEIGNDPKAYREKLRAEVMAEIKAEEDAKQVAATAPSLANQPSIGGRIAPAPTLTPLDDLLQ